MVKWLTTKRQPLNSRDTRLLISWWSSRGWFCTKYLSYKRRGKRFWDIKVER